MELILEMEHRWLLLPGSDESRKYEEQMLTNNRIPGLLPTELLLRDGKKKFRYDITEQQSLRQIAEEERLSGNFLKNLFQSVETAVTDAKQYLLREEGFMLTPELIFQNERGEISLCYHPGTDKNLRQQLAELSEWLLGKLDACDSAAVYAGYSLHVLCREENVSFRRLDEIFQREDFRNAGADYSLENAASCVCGAEFSDSGDSEPENGSEADSLYGPQGQEPQVPFLPVNRKPKSRWESFGKTAGELMVLVVIIGILIYMIP